MFDSNSSLLYIDNCTSSSLTPHRKDFKSYKPLITEKKIIGIGGQAPGAIGIGTVEYRIRDDNNVEHTWTLRDVFHVPTSPARLLSPQQFAQQRQTYYQDDHAHCDTRAYRIIIEWSQGATTASPTKRRLTVPLNEDNVGTIAINQGFSSFASFIRAFPQFSHRSGYISDDEGDEGNESVHANHDE